MGWLDGATVRPSGEDALVIEYGEAIDQAVGRRVGGLARAIDAAPPCGLVEVVPTFRSLLLLYDPDATTGDALLAALPPEPLDEDEGASVRWRVPVCLDDAVAEDLAQAAQALALPPARVRERLLESPFQLGMYGFAPGFAYLSGLDPSLTIGRRAAPRPPMAAGSVMIAGGMAALASASMPTGWYVVGRAAVTLFRPHAEPMVPFAVGDRLVFAPVGVDEIERLRESPDGGVVRLDR